MKDLSALHDIALFVEIARTGSFRQASQNLGVSTATLSRRLAGMEQRFGTRLFNRTTRRVELTDAGRRYFDRCEHLADEARLAQEALRDAAQRPNGHLRVSIPAELGAHHLGPLLSEFARHNPGLSFEIELAPPMLLSAPVEPRCDIELRLGATPAEAASTRRIGWLEQCLFASPAYLALRGRPAQPNDLAEHDCIVAGGSGSGSTTRWRLSLDLKVTTVQVRGRFGVDNPCLMRVLAERGMGIAALASALGRDALGAGRLMPVLPDWSLPKLPVHAATLSRTPPPGAGALLDFLADRFSAA